MLIDWFTLVAQIINFLVLVLILKHFLFGRIEKAMDEREKRISSLLKEADQKKKEAERELESHQLKNREFESKREAMVSQTKEEVEIIRKELVNKARDEIEQTQNKWKESIKKEKISFLLELRRQIAQETYNISRRALSDLANAELEQNVIEVFINRLKTMDKENWKSFDTVSPYGQLFIKSAFEIPERTRQRIRDVIHENIPKDIVINFDISRELILGIELKLNGHKIAYSLEDYLESLENRVSEKLVDDRSE